MNKPTAPRTHLLGHTFFIERKHFIYLQIKEINVSVATSTGHTGRTSQCGRTPFQLHPIKHNLI